MEWHVAASRGMLPEQQAAGMPLSGDACGRMFAAQHVLPTRGNFCRSRYNYYVSWDNNK